MSVETAGGNAFGSSLCFAPAWGCCPQKPLPEGAEGSERRVGMAGRGCCGDSDLWRRERPRGRHTAGMGHTPGRRVHFPSPHRVFCCSCLTGELRLLYL